jgi:hypothetical protein
MSGGATTACDNGADTARVNIDTGEGVNVDWRLILTYLHAFEDCYLAFF